MTHAVIYLRQSIDPSGERAAVQRQLKACKALCKSKGFERITVVEENDTSASKLKPRPKYKQMLADATAGRYDVIVAWHVDRLCRRVLDLEEIITTGLPIVTVTGDIDLSSDVGRMVARIITVVAQAEVERKGARQRLGNKQRATRGIPHASPRPFGYRRDGQVLTIEPKEAKAIRTAYKRLLAGASLRSIATEWNAAGHVTSKGREWNPWSVRDRLLSPMYAGLSYYDGKQVGIGTWDAIVPEETWRAAVAFLSNPERRTTPGNARKYLLAGLARCGHPADRKDTGAQVCGALMATGRASVTGTKRRPDGSKVDGNRTYRCSKHKHLSRKADLIDATVEAIVIARLSAKDAHELLHDKEDVDTAALRADIQTRRARLDEIALAGADGSWSIRQVTLATEKLTREIEALETQVAASGRRSALVGLPGAAASKKWDDLDLNRKRAVIDALMDVTILPVPRGTRSFDPETVQVRMRAKPA